MFIFYASTDHRYSCNECNDYDLCRECYLVMRELHVARNHIELLATGIPFVVKYIKKDRWIDRESTKIRGLKTFLTPSYHVYCCVEAIRDCPDLLPSSINCKEEIEKEGKATEKEKESEAASTTITNENSIGIQYDYSTTQGLPRQYMLFAKESPIDFMTYRLHYSERASESDTYVTGSIEV